MKRTLLFITTGALAFSFVFFPAFSYAAETFPTTCRVRSAITVDEAIDLTGSGTATAISSGTVLPSGSTNAAVVEAFGLICAFSLIKYITNVVFLVVFAFSVIIIAVAGFLYLTSAGNEEKTKKAKAYLLAATVGIAIAVLSRLIPAIVKSFLGA